MRRVEVAEDRPQRGEQSAVRGLPLDGTRLGIFQVATGLQACETERETEGDGGAQREESEDVGYHLLDHDDKDANRLKDREVAKPEHEDGDRLERYQDHVDAIEKLRTLEAQAEIVKQGDHPEKERRLEEQMRRAIDPPEAILVHKARGALQENEISRVNVVQYVPYHPHNLNGVVFDSGQHPTLHNVLVRLEREDDEAMQNRGNEMHDPSRRESHGRHAVEVAH
mmetsp:Transcript_35298/g.97707  ORF Transcript_35298/g.97707 Transcript_35298/m.97707 type:complete len:225 (-) Transcript_35298:26-700(-)|eukprot:3266387-Prymnesium_polylepis.1